jgi:prolyl-tRNA synthetase
MPTTRLSHLFLRTLREVPADADTAGYALLVRGGFVRRVSSGVYTFLPLGLRVLHRLSDVIREELNAAGMQELLMPALSPIELWEQSGRAAKFGSDALPAMIVDARGGRFVLGLTHEEVVTETVAAEVDSYRQLPLTVYQIQTKFRDEARPRFGLLRGREFLMCDAYSFDVDKEQMGVTYEGVKVAYLAIFGRLGLEVQPVEALSGAIGGDVNHEFMVESAIGEDHFVRCTKCGYAANTERAEVAAPGLESVPVDEHPALRRVATPGAITIDDVVAQLADEGVVASRTLKTVAVIDDADSPAVIVVPGDREAKLPPGWRLFGEKDFAARPSLVRGFLGPVRLGVHVVVDASVAVDTGTWVVGANEPDAHYLNAVFGRDFFADDVRDAIVARSGDGCPTCGSALELVRSVEAAHIFQLGHTYSSVFPDASFVAEDDTSHPFWMACYGIGVSRLMAVLAETFHDEQGLCWPASSSPFDVHVTALGAQRSDDVRAASERVVEELDALGLDVCFDDRDLSAGVALADADLIGVPVRVTVGTRGLARGVVELKDRRSGEVRELELVAAAEGVAATVAEARAELR